MNISGPFVGKPASYFSVTNSFLHKYGFRLENEGEGVVVIEYPRRPPLVAEIFPYAVNDLNLSQKRVLSMFWENQGVVEKALREFIKNLDIDWIESGLDIESRVKFVGLTICDYAEFDMIFDMSLASKSGRGMRIGMDIRTGGTRELSQNEYALFVPKGGPID